MYYHSSHGNGFRLTPLKSQVIILSSPPAQPGWSLDNVTSHPVGPELGTTTSVPGLLLCLKEPSDLIEPMQVILSGESYDVVGPNGP